MKPSSLAHWSRKFRHAFRGLKVGISGQSSFLVHLIAAPTVVAMGVLLNVSPLEWCVLLLCIGAVISAELFNSALELSAKAITSDFDDHIRDALDVASAAVLVVSIISIVVGATIFVFRLGFYFGWWGGYFM